MLSNVLAAAFIGFSVGLNLAFIAGRLAERWLRGQEHGRSDDASA